MYLACVEVAAESQARVVQEEFVDLEPAKVWASQESARRNDATGNAAVFETSGPLMAEVWEHVGGGDELSPASDAPPSMLTA